jgi:hypothetical protein
MNTWFEIKWLIEGALFTTVSIYFARGILYRGSRAKWGRFGGGKQMSIFSQFVWLSGFVFFGIDSFLLLFHHHLPFMSYVIFLWLALIFIMMWRDKVFDP